MELPSPPVLPSKPQYLILKIAAGVLLGILAASAMYVAGNEWLSYRRFQAEAEAQLKEAGIRRKKIENAAQDLVLPSALKVSEVVERCGPPRVFHSFGYHPSMDYSGSDGHPIKVHFGCREGATEQDCVFLFMSRIRQSYESESREGYEDGFLSDGSVRQGDPIRQVEELPCLAGVETQPLR